jgi:hypothetical protein
MRVSGFRLCNSISVVSFNNLFNLAATRFGRTTIFVRKYIYSGNQFSNSVNCQLNS